VSEMPRGGSTEFRARLESFRRKLAAAETHLRTLQLGAEIDELRRAAGQEEFRIAVVGRFKTGKSTLVNALLGKELSPSDTLRCTSSRIEFRGGGTEPRFFGVH